MDKQSFTAMERLENTVVCQSTVIESQEAEICNLIRRCHEALEREQVARAELAKAVDEGNILRTGIDALAAECARLTAWILEAAAVFNTNGAAPESLDAALGLVRLCHEGRAALDELARLRALLPPDLLRRAASWCLTAGDDGWQHYSQAAARTDAAALEATAEEWEK